MSRVKMGFELLNIPDKIDRSELFVTKMTGNPNFLTPSPALADVTTALDAARIAYIDSRDGGKEKTKTLRLRMKELTALVRRLAAYVQDASGGNEEIILSSGFSVVEKGNPIVIGQVKNLRTVNGSSVGSIRAIFDKVRGAGAYVVEIADTDASGPYRIHTVTLKTRLDLTGLVAGKVYWIRIYAVGHHGTGIPSDISVHTAAI